MTLATLDHIWLKRWNQDIEGALQDFSQFCHDKEWDLTSLEKKKIKAKEDAEAVLLQASFYRAEANFKKSSRIIARVYKETDSKLFRLNFELGVDHWVAGDVSSALDCFLQAESLAENDYQKFYALTNLLWCLEELDLDREKVEAQVDALFRSVDDTIVTHAFDQYKAYLSRKKFYMQGRADNFSGSIISQKDFFNLYTSLLPYTDQVVDLSLESLCSPGRYLWQGSYRYRTLQGYFIPADETPLRVGDAIDRLYLWSWYWLVGERDISLKKLELCLKSIVYELDLDCLGKENQLLLRNALSWVEVICPRLMSGLKTTLNFLAKKTSPNYKLLDEEFYFIQWVKNHFYGGKVDVAQKGIAAIMRPYFQDLSQRSFNLLPGLKPLGEKLNNGENDKRINIIVDYSRGEITHIENKEKVKSNVLVRFFHLAYEKTQFSTSEIDPSYSNNKRKVYNLLARVRSFDDSIKVCFENEMLYVSMLRDGIVFEGEYASDLKNIKSVSSSQYTTKTLDDHISYMALKVLFQDSFKRADLEKTYKISKASACRLIDQWVGKKIVEKLGRGKGVHYKWLI